jgi:hypothetical protein
LATTFGFLETTLLRWAFNFAFCSFSFVALRGFADARFSALRLALFAAIRFCATVFAFDAGAFLTLAISVSRGQVRLKKP